MTAEKYDTMIDLFSGQVVPCFSRRILLILSLVLVATTGVTLAELPQPNSSQHNRTPNYSPLAKASPTPIGPTQNVSHNRLPAYEPVRQDDAPATPQSHFAQRPAPEPQESSTSSPTSGGRTSRSNVDDLLSGSLPQPGGAITNMEQRSLLDNLYAKSVAAKSGDATPSGDSTPVPPPTGGDGNASTTSGANAGLIRVVQIFQDPQSKEWYAKKEGEKRPIPLEKNGNRFYFVEDGVISEVILQSDTNVTGGTKSPLADDQTRNAVLLIMTIMAVLAALSVGFLAFDYKHRWEQEIVSQNSRMIGTSVPHGTFADLDSLEPETLRFSSPDYRSLDDSFDHSFRTIA